MPVQGVNGYLDIENSGLRVSQVGIANTTPQHILSVGSNLYVSGDSSDVLNVTGNVLCQGIKVDLMEITPSYDLAAVSNVGNVTSTTVQFTNPDMGIVATGNVTIGSTLALSGFRITTQAPITDDLESITESTILKPNSGITPHAIQITNATDSTSAYTGALIIGTNSNNGGLGVAGNVHIAKGIYAASNLEVGTSNLFVDTTTSNVGIGTNTPDASLHVIGDAIVTGTISGSGAGLTSIPSGAITGTLSQWTTNGTMIHYNDGNVGIGTNTPDAPLHVIGNSLVTGDVTIGDITRLGRTFVVTVQQVSGANKYFIDGVDRPILKLYRDQTYIFDLSSSTLATHPFIFSETNTNDGNASGTPYTTGITNVGNYGSDQIRTFVVPSDAPTTLYYYCTQHSGMGATVSISPNTHLMVTGNVAIEQDLIVTGSIQSSTPVTISLSKTSVRTADVLTVTGLYFNSSLSLQLLGQDGTSLFSVTDYTFVTDTALTFKIGSPNAAQIAQSPYKIRLTTGNGTIVDSSLTLTYDASLYEFTSHTFTTAGQVGREGAAISVYKAAYSSAAWAQTDYFALGGSAGNTSYNGFQEWTVPKTATYTINAYGARGGDATSLNSSAAAAGNQTPGKGAHVSATFALTVGTKIVIICGHEGMPQTGDANGSNGGGGGTWVLTENFTQNTDSLYMVAGGGTGTSEYGNQPPSEPFANAIGNVQGTDSSGGSGGGNGSGGGGGFAGDGTAGVTASNGKRPYNGALGGFNGQSSYAGGDGGFGGGGAQQDQSPGGGGGYRGARGSYYSGASNYHGSQSYIMLSGAGGVTVTNRAFNGNHTGATGYVSIVKNN